MFALGPGKLDLKKRAVFKGMWRNIDSDVGV